MTTYVWDHLDIGYMQVGSKLCIIIIGTFLLIFQGMCDIVAPLLVVIDDEVDKFKFFRKIIILLYTITFQMTVYSCFTNLMERMIK